MSDATGAAEALLAYLAASVDAAELLIDRAIAGCAEDVRRAGHGFRTFANYRLRILLHAGGVRRPATRPLPPLIRTRSPHSDM